MLREISRRLFNSSRLLPLVRGRYCTFGVKGPESNQIFNSLFLHKKNIHFFELI